MNSPFPYYIDHIIIALLITIVVGAEVAAVLYYILDFELIKALIAGFIAGLHAGMVTYISREVAQWEMKGYWDHKGYLWPCVVLTVLYGVVLWLN